MKATLSIRGCSVMASPHSPPLPGGRQGRGVVRVVRVVVVMIGFGEGEGRLGAAC